jgi:hypothetical protein
MGPGKNQTFLPRNVLNHSRIARFLKDVLGSPESIGSFARQGNAPELFYNAPGLGWYDAKKESP